MYLLIQITTISMNRITLKVKTACLANELSASAALSRISATFCLISSAWFRNVNALQKIPQTKM